jgi:lysophospholipase L1-like esterase
MIRSQRETALAHGAAFWNSSQVMGGAYALCEWKRQSPALVSGDNLHLSRQGYTLVGEKFAEAVLAGL